MRASICFARIAPFARARLAHERHPRSALSVTSTPIFPRSLKLGLEEPVLVLKAFERLPPEPWVMLDVGAHRGTSTLPFAQQGWRVHAFEPDPSNRTVFHKVLDDFPNVSVDARAVSDEDSERVTLYDSAESSGISSLLAFTESHRPAAEVDTVRLDTYLESNPVERVDLLKIDTEGFDLMVLRGFPWDVFRPPFVLCEFEDNKTRQLGYASGNLIGFLRELGYQVLISEWHPIERYGITHSFARLRLYNGEDPSTSSWGNILAIKEQDAVGAIFRDAIDLIHPRTKERPARTDLLGFKVWRWSALLRSRVSSKRGGKAQRSAGDSS